MTECEADFFLASDPTIGLNNYFGIGAIKRDLLVVSAAGNSPSGSLSQTGAFYIYNFITQWELEDKYLPDDPQNGAQLGECIATDGARIAFGEPGFKISNQQVGRVQVWHKPGSSWAHMDHLLPDDEEANTTFAGSGALHECVAINGDVVVVGAPDWNDGVSKSSAGRVHIFEYDSTTDEWTETEINAGDIPNLSTQADGRFGTSVDIWGRRIIIGEPGRDDGTEDGAGAAYVFEYNTGTSAWEFDAKLAPTVAPVEDDNFGHSVRIDGNAAVATAYNPNAASNSFAVVFRYSGGSWSEEQELSPDGVDDASAWWGIASDISGNLVAIGDQFYGEENAESGGVFIDERSGGTGAWSLVHVIVENADNVDQCDQFGSVVSIDGNNGIVAAFRDEDPNGTTQTGTGRLVTDLVGCDSEVPVE